MKGFGKIIFILLVSMIIASIVFILGANSDWATLRIPSFFIRGSQKDFEFEARVWLIVTISFFSGFFFSLILTMISRIKTNRNMKNALNKISQLNEELKELKTRRVKDQINS